MPGGYQIAVARRLHSDSPKSIFQAIDVSSSIVYMSRREVTVYHKFSIQCRSNGGKSNHKKSLTLQSLPPNTGFSGLDLASRGRSTVSAAIAA